MYNNYCICYDCAKDKYLKDYIYNNLNKKESICSICLNKKESIEILQDKKITDLCRFLIRYHYSEFEYNTHMGGDMLPYMFYKKNHIISNNFSKEKNTTIIDKDYDRDIEIEEFLYALFDLWDHKSHIELYKGNIDGIRHYFADIIKEDKSILWENIKNDLIEKNYFLLEEDVTKKIKKYIEKTANKLEKDKVFFRARVGFENIETEENTYGIKSIIKAPYRDGKIGKPPASKATAGRINRHGISYLYLGSSIDTCVSELKPHPGSYLSIGKFILNKEFKVVDLRTIDLVNLLENDLEIFKLLRDLSEDLSKPISPTLNNNYLISQFLSDIIRKLGYEGIMYNSSVSDGFNLAIFDDSDIVYDKQSPKLIKIKSVNYNYGNVGNGFHPVSEEQINIIEE